ncbi:MAG: twin-arginine translocase TatA/TatE family subunit [Fulvivirga sp.]|nr:twin-arginine translocase TatA/TatE family subunit [Fulvivirga sp.]
MKSLLAIGMPGGWELIVIVLVILIFFGAKKIPELARGLGKGIREFKDATKEIKKDIEESSSNSASTSTTSEDDKKSK